MNINTMSVLGKAKENFALDNNLRLFVAVLMHDYIDKITWAKQDETISEFTKMFHLTVYEQYIISRRFDSKGRWCKDHRRAG